MTESEWFDCTNPHAMLEHLQKKGGSKWSLFSWFRFRRDRDDSRKLLLFAVACCRRIESLLVDHRSRYALEIAERIAEGQARRKDRKRATAAAKGAAFDASGLQMGVGGWLAAAQARAAEAVAAALSAEDPANTAAAITKEAVRAWAKGASASNTAYPGSIGSTLITGIPWSAPVIVTVPTRPAVPPEEAAGTSEAKIQCEYLRDIFGNPFQPATKNGQILKKSNAVALAKSIYDARSFSRVSEIADVLSSEGLNDSDIVAHCRQQRDHVRGCWVLDLLLGR